MQKVEVEKQISPHLFSMERVQTYQSDLEKNPSRLSFATKGI